MPATPNFFTSAMLSEAIEVLPSSSPREGKFSLALRFGLWVRVRVAISASGGVKHTAAAAVSGCSENGKSRPNSPYLKKEKEAKDQGWLININRIIFASLFLNPPDPCSLDNVSAHDSDSSQFREEQRFGFQPLSAQREAFGSGSFSSGLSGRSSLAVR